MIKIDKEFKKRIGPVSLLCFRSDVVVDNEQKALWNKIDAQLVEITDGFSVEKIATIPSISDTRMAYKRLGKDPSRYRPSAEALLRRVVSGKGLYRINNVVDCLNLISISTGYSIGGYDADKIEGDVLFTYGKADDQYEAIGRGDLNIADLPVLRDARGCFGSPTSDSVRTSITSATKDFLMVFFCFGNDVYERPALENQVESYLASYAGVASVQKFLVQ